MDQGDLTFEKFICVQVINSIWKNMENTKKLFVRFSDSSVFWAGSLNQETRAFSELLPFKQA